MENFLKALKQLKSDTVNFRTLNFEPNSVGKNIVSPIILPEILRNQLLQHPTYSNFRWVLENSSLAKALIKIPAEIICKNEIAFYDKAGRKYDDIGEIWESIDGNKLLLEVIKACETCGWCLVEKVKTQGFSYELGKTEKFQVIWPSDIRAITRDEYGNILSYNVESDTTVQFGVSDAFYMQRTVLSSEVYHVENFPQPNHLGQSSMQSVFYDCIYKEYLKHIQLNYLLEIASPLLLLPVFNTMSESEINAFIEDYQEIKAVRRVLTSQVNPLGKEPVMKPEYIPRGDSSQIDFPSILERMTKEAAQSEGLPAASMDGSGKGALSAARGGR